MTQALLTILIVLVLTGIVYFLRRALQNPRTVVVESRPDVAAAHETLPSTVPAKYQEAPGAPEVGSARPPAAAAPSTLPSESCPLEAPPAPLSAPSLPASPAGSWHAQRPSVPGAPPLPPMPERRPRRKPREHLDAVQTQRVEQDTTGRHRKPRPSVPILDPVDCTVFASPVAAPGQHLLVQVFAHRPEHGDTAAIMAREFDSATTRRGFRRLEIDVERGSELRFQLDMPGLAIDEPTQTLRWNGTPASVQFGVSVPAQLRSGTVIASLRVDLDTVPVGILKFKLNVESAVQVPPQREPRGDVAYTFHKAFISYASSDRTEVLKRVQILRQLQIDFFQDILSLEPGDRWQKLVYRHIDECDLFLLFWSSAAKRSEWVLKEAMYALGRAKADSLGRPEIRPVIIEGPPPVEPPPELKDLHFNDPLVYLMR